MTQAKFDKAVEIVQGLPKDGPIQPTNDERLYFYARYKQVTVGDVNVPKPGIMEFTNKAKWGAWNDLKGRTDTEELQKEYVEKLLELLKNANDTKYTEQINAA